MYVAVACRQAPRPVPGDTGKTAVVGVRACRHPTHPPQYSKAAACKSGDKLCLCSVTACYDPYLMLMILVLTDKPQ